MGKAVSERRRREYYPSQHGVWVNGIPLKEELLTLPAQLAGQGYRTAVEVLALDTGFPGPLSHA